MTAPLVSVVIPAFRAARTLESTVASALNQTVGPLEIIIVDDGSPDGTLAVARALESADPRVRVVAKENGGAPAARNSGCAEARGRYLAFLDADDQWLPDKLERQLEFLDAHPGAEAVQCGALYVDDDLELISVRRCHISDDPLMDSVLFANLPGFASTVMIERTAFERIGGYDESLFILEDWELAVRCSRYCGMVSLPDALTLYRQHPDNRSLNLEIHIEPGFAALDALFADPELPARIRRRKRRIYANFFLMLSGGALRASQPWDAVRWGWRAVRTHPATTRYVLALPARRIQRMLSRFA